MSIQRYAGDKLTGLSTDTKPLNILDGATFYETDTLTIYLKVSGAWVLITATSTYTNDEETPVTVGGIEGGSTFFEVTLQDMWTDLLYPYQYPAFTFFTVSGGNPLEVGQTLPATLLFSWNSSEDANVLPNSIVISDTTGNILVTQSADDTNVPYTYGTPVTRSTTGTYTWNILGTNTEATTYTRNTTKSWYWRVFWGTSASTAAPTEALIEGLLNNPEKASGSGSYSFEKFDYKYLAIPNEYGIPSFITYNSLPFALADASDGYNLGSGQITYTSISITNTYGAIETYNIFRSKNPIVGLVYMLVEY